MFDDFVIEEFNKLGDIDILRKILSSIGLFLTLVFTSVLGAIFITIHPLTLIHRLILGKFNGFDESSGVHKLFLTITYFIVILSGSFSNGDGFLFPFGEFFTKEIFRGDSEFDRFHIFIIIAVCIIVSTILFYKFYIEKFLFEDTIEHTSSTNSSELTINETNTTIFLSVVSTVFIFLTLFIIITFNKELDKYLFLTKVSNSILSAALILFLPVILIYRMYFGKILVRDENLGYLFVAFLIITLCYYFLLKFIQPLFIKITSYTFEIIREEYNYLEVPFFIILNGVVLIYFSIKTTRWLFK